MESENQWVKAFRNDSGLLSVLDEREMYIIFQRFGLDPNGKPRTLQEVGKKMELSRERIRQIQNIALSKLRRKIAEKTP